MQFGSTIILETILALREIDQILLTATASFLITKTQYPNRVDPSTWYVNLFVHGKVLAQ